MIWASPPCKYNSKARTKGPPNDLKSSDALVKRVLEMAAGRRLFIENPYTGKLKERSLLDELPMRVLDYCEYGMLYSKRTAIWTTTD